MPKTRGACTLHGSRYQGLSLVTDRTHPPREWLQYRYVDPTGLLVDMNSLAARYQAQGWSPEEMSLRNQELRRYHETRQGALFCHGLATAVLHRPVLFAPVENEDFDGIARWKRSDGEVFTPVQLKELVPAHLNPNTTIEEQTEKLKRYNSPQLVVAIHLNRAVRFDLAKLRVPKLNIGELWMLGAVSPDGRDWMLYGDFTKGEPRPYPFHYPMTTNDEATK